MYVPSDKLAAKIVNNFTFHPASQEQQGRYASVRRRCRELANDITTLTPESREQSLALSKLEEVMFWANAAIARNEETSP